MGRHSCRRAPASGTAVTGRRPGRPDRRIAPRPLPAHLASAMMLWTSSRAALTSLSGGLPRSNGGPAEPSVPPQLRAIGSEIARRGTEAVRAALDAEILARAAAMLVGLEAYRRH